MTSWLLLHGTPLTPAVWDGLCPLLSGDVATPPVIPGGGPPGEVQATIARQLAAVVNLEPPWHVVGHSFGGQVALELAIQSPQLVSRLTLLCTRDTPYRPFAAGVGVVGTDVETSLRRWFSREELVVDGPAVQYARTALSAAGRAQWAKALAAISVFDCSAQTSSIRCPTAVVAAAHDPVSSPEVMSAMHRRLVYSQMVTLNDAWHMSVFADPVRLRSLIAEVLPAT